MTPSEPLWRAAVQDVLDGRRRWCVIHADCREVLPLLPDKSVQHVITDPPYEAEAHTKARRSRDVLEGRMASDAIDFATMDEETRAAVCAQAARLCAGWVLAFCQVEGVHPWRAAMEAAGLKWRRAQIWVKPDSAPQFTGDRPAQGYECIASSWAGRGKSTWNGGGRRGVYTHMVGAQAGGSDHPTTKPLPLMLELVELFTDPGEVILEPFAGSGTTGVAALRLGRRCILVEKDAAYAALCRERMEAEEQGLSLKAARAGQLSLLAP